jgi:hypothetical protein
MGASKGAPFLLPCQYVMQVWYIPSLPEVILDGLDDVVEVWPHTGIELDRHVTHGDIR